MGKPKTRKLGEAELLDSIPTTAAPRVRRSETVLGYSSKPEQPRIGAGFVRTPEYETLLAAALDFDEEV